MDFRTSILQLAESIKKHKDAIQTEEATKNAFIMPMIAALEYDIFNPFEVVPEMDCDLTKKGDKIDYAIKKNNNTIILIECKHCKQNLNLYSTQLSKYYAASNARFGVLTNGIEYRFYTDIDKINIMDEMPFLTVDMLHLSDIDIELLENFKKSHFYEKKILDIARELKYTEEIKRIISCNILNPTNDYIRFIIRQIYNGAITNNITLQFTPIIKKAINTVIDDVVKSRVGLIGANEENHIHIETNKDESTTEIAKEKIEAYNIIKEILKNNVGINDLIYQDYKSYFLVAIGNKYWGVCRIKVKAKNLYIYFPKREYSSYEKIKLENANGIYQYSERLIQAFKMAFLSREEYINNRRD